MSIQNNKTVYHKYMILLKKHLDLVIEGKEDDKEVAFTLDDDKVKSLLVELIYKNPIYVYNYIKTYKPLFISRQTR